MATVIADVIAGGRRHSPRTRPCSWARCCATPTRPCATIWVETDRACSVSVVVGDDTFRADTWSVHDHHYALVRIDHLAPCTASEYRVALDDHAGVAAGRDPSSRPASSAPSTPMLRSASPSAAVDDRTRSTRSTSPTIGADALVALATRMAESPHVVVARRAVADRRPGVRRRALRRHRRPGSATPTPTATRTSSTRSRTSRSTPGSTTRRGRRPPCVGCCRRSRRGCCSTTTTCATTGTRRCRGAGMVTAQPWWHDRVVGGLRVLLGVPAPRQPQPRPTRRRRGVRPGARHHRRRRADPLPRRRGVARRRRCRRRSGGATTATSAAPAAACASSPSTAECSRQLDPDDRRMVDAPEWAWVREHVIDVDHPFDHLVLASTLPWLMLPGVHHLEGWDEAVSEGAWGRPGKWLGERVRQVLDLEHWAAFRESFARDGRVARRCGARGPRRRRPCSCSAVTCTATTPRRPSSPTSTTRSRRSTNSRCRRSATTSRASASSPTGCSTAGRWPASSTEWPGGPRSPTSP